MSLVFLALLVGKAISAIQVQAPGREAKRLALLRGVLYAVTLGLVVLGSRSIGYNLAAEFYSWTSRDNLDHGQISRAYSNALRAVELRPGTLRHWRTLAMTKAAQHQCAALVDDLAAFQSLSEGELNEEDAYSFAACYYHLAEYDKSIALTQRLIAKNPFFSAPYVLQGFAYTAQKKYREAERSFLAVLQAVPGQQAAVEGLAHVYFLSGNRERALAVLDVTARHPFPPEARKRFEVLKELYAQ